MGAGSSGRAADAKNIWDKQIDANNPFFRRNRTLGSLCSMNESAGNTNDDVPFSKDASFGYSLLILTRLVSADYYASINSSNLKINQLFLLLELWLDEPLTQVDLARRLRIGKATTGESVASLEKQGFVERRASQRDRRAFDVYLTQAGRELEALALRRSVGQNERLKAAVGARRFQIALKVMQDLSSTLQRDIGSHSEKD